MAPLLKRTKQIQNYELEIDKTDFLCYNESRKGDKNMIFLKCCSGNKIKFNPSHKHDFWELIRLATEKAFYHADGKVYELSKGDLILIPPSVNHGCEYKEYFSDSVIQFSSCDFPKIPILIHDIDGNIERLFYMVERLYIEKEDFYANY